MKVTVYYELLENTPHTPTPTPTPHTPHTHTLVAPYVKCKVIMTQIGYLLGNYLVEQVVDVR